MRSIISIFAIVVCIGGTVAQENRDLRHEKPTVSLKRIALVIGNGAYQKVPVLDNPGNDATDIAEALQSLGFEVIKGTNTDRMQMKRLINEFGEKLVRSKGVGLFYYAGHGIEVRGRNFLIPVDADIAREFQTEFEAIDVNLILTSMDDANNGFNIVVLDACRNNPFSRGWTRSGDTGGLANVNAPTGTFIAFAAAPGRTASDGKGTRNGIFTGALLKNLKRPNLKLEEVFKATREGVIALTGGNQVPWDSSSIQGDFYFNFSKTVEPQTQANSTAPVLKPTPLPTATPVSIMQDFDGQGAYWNEMRNRDNRSGYELYLAEYPTGKHSAEAKDRIDKFKQDELTRLKNAEQAKWLESQRLNTKDAYQAYLSSYPNGGFAADARAGLKALEIMVERAKWRDAQDLNTKDGYTAYLATYPNGEFAAEARSGIKAIENRDDQAKWDEVQILNRKSAFQSYLSTYPNGKYSVAAYQKIREFVDAEALKQREDYKATEKAKWDEAKRISTIAAYKEYLASYPNGEFASLARLGLRDFGEVIDAAPPSTLTPVSWNRAPESPAAVSRSVEKDSAALAGIALDHFRRDDFYSFNASAFNAIGAGGSLEFHLQHHDFVMPGVAILQTGEQLHPIKLTLTARTISFDPQLKPGIPCSFINFTIPLEQVTGAVVDETGGGIFSKNAGIYLKLSLLNSKDPKKPHTLNFANPTASYARDSRGITRMQTRSQTVQALAALSAIIRSISVNARSSAAAKMPTDVILESSSDIGENANATLPFVESIVEAYIKASAGGNAKWSTEIRRGDYTFNGITRSFETYIKGRTKYSSVFTDEKNENFYESGYDGNVGWSKANKEKPKRMDSATEMALQRDLTMSALADVREFNKIYPVAKLMGRGKFGDFAVYVIEANLIGGRTETFYFDITTGLLRRIDIKSEDPKKKGEIVKTTLVLDEYAEVRGTKIIVAWRQISPTANISFKVTSALFNSSIDDVKFKMPDR